MKTFIRLKEVTKKVGLPKSSVYALIQNGDFLKPIKLSKRTSALLESDIEEWIESKIQQKKTLNLNNTMKLKRETSATLSNDMVVVVSFK